MVLSLIFSEATFKVYVCGAYRAYILLSVQEHACMAPHMHDKPTIKVILI